MFVRGRAGSKEGVLSMNAIVVCGFSFPLHCRLAAPIRSDLECQTIPLSTTPLAITT